jgi:1-acyl-sn-glycerol-3-phosphate acyltransferase
MTTMDIAFFDHHDPIARPAWLAGVGVLVGTVFRLRGIVVRVDGHERLGDEPAILACNATHQYDLLPIRLALRRLGRAATTVSKGKNYHGRVMRTVSVALGSVPLVSRGYVVTMDFLALHGRKPSEAEYRALRHHLDTGAALPDGPTFDAVQGTPRHVLGMAFHPARRTWRETAEALYVAMMQRTVALCGQALARGADIQMFPQGSSATRLSEGHIGTMQLARALDLAVVPVGVSGCLEVFPQRRRLTMRAGEVVLRVGQPYRPDLAALPASFRPFDPTDETTFRPVLEHATRGLMERINGLVDPAYRWAPDRRGDGAAGVERFA